MFKAIKFLFIFLYHFMFIDQATGTQSNTKFFANVGYIIWCVLFPWVVKHGSSAPMELWLVFGAVVIGNRSLNVWMQNKSGVPCDVDSTWKGVMNGPAQPVQPDPTQVNVSVSTPAPAPTPPPAPVAAPPAAAQCNVPDVSDLVDGNK